MRQEIAAGLELNDIGDISGAENLPSCFAVTDLAAHSIGAVGGALAQLLQVLSITSETASVQVDRRLSSLWFQYSLAPIGWRLPPIWDSIAGDYKSNDGWIKLHTNLPHHRRAALAVLGCDADRSVVARAVANWSASVLESEIVKEGGVAAAMRSRDEWTAHPQGAAIADEPLIGWSPLRTGNARSWSATRSAPLAGLRVLDLTRVLAGPVATRTLAGFGADVLRIDPYGWEEDNIVPDITLGKRCACLDLTAKEDRAVFESLLREADLLVHGYRPGALDGLGYGEAVRREFAPNMIEVKLDAYGWTGPWRDRRGFDSLVQMSCGIANEGMRWARADKPTPLPVQALDHATGYLLAAAALRALAWRERGDGIRHARLSLARTAELLLAHPQNAPEAAPIDARDVDYAATAEVTPWGSAKRLKPPLNIEGTKMVWQRPACELGSAPAAWP